MTDMRAILPTPATGYALNPSRGYFSVLIPIARTNEITNPSFELGTTGWSAVGGASIARVTTQQAVGVASLQITLTGVNDGVRSSALPMTTGELRACSCLFKGTAGRRYRFRIEDSLAGSNAQTTITANGRWQEVVWYCHTLTTQNYFVFVGAIAAGADVVSLDAVQVEVIQPGETASTYLDGDQVGVAPSMAAPSYGWNGAPHASTSYRSAQERGGGMIMALDLAGFVLTAIIGLGLAPVAHSASPYAQLDGAAYDRTRLTERTFSLVGRIDARDDATRTRQLAMLEGWLSRDRVSIDQPLRLRYVRYDGLTPTSEVGLIDALYTQGLEGNTDTRHAAAVPLQFTMYAPYITLSREEGAALTVQQTVANANGVLLRTPTGQWKAIGSGASGGSVYAIAQGLDGAYYIGGAFTAFGGVANTRAIAKYDPITGVISAMGSGAVSGAVSDIQIAPNGDIWAVGTFQDMGGVAAADWVARWNGSAWVAVGVPSAVGWTGPLQSAFDSAGNFYYGTGSNGTLRKWDGAAWSTVGTAAIVGNTVRAPDGTLIVDGNFNTISGVGALNIARYNPTTNTWTALTGTIPGVPFPLAFDAAGNLYAGGSASGSNLWRYNGVGWTQIGQVGGAGQTLWGIAALGDGLYVSGTFTSAAGVALADRFGFWNGSALVGADVDLPGTPTIYAVRAFRDGSLALGYDTTGSALTAARTSITNSGAGRAWPILTLTGPSSGTARIYQVANVTTGRALYLNLTLNAGEQVTINCDPDVLSVVSTFQGDVSSALLPGSQEADFFVQPGVNSISMFASAASVGATLRWRPTFQSLNQLSFR